MSDTNRPRRDLGRVGHPVPRGRAGASGHDGRARTAEIPALLAYRSHSASDRPIVDDRTGWHVDRRPRGAGPTGPDAVATDRWRSYVRFSLAVDRLYGPLTRLRP